ncbi:MAG: hypothetical protein PHW04_06840 [Candidatus Wallbacteria bacterium]|nr:hypothetical protein [Candidatus Wallbacteria bacterium]
MKLKTIARVFVLSFLILLLAGFCFHKLMLEKLLQGLEKGTIDPGKESRLQVADFMYNSEQKDFAARLYEAGQILIRAVPSPDRAFNDYMEDSAKGLAHFESAEIRDTLSSLAELISSDGKYIARVLRGGTDVFPPGPHLFTATRLSAKAFSVYAAWLFSQGRPAEAVGMLQRALFTGLAVSRGQGGENSLISGMIGQAIVSIVYRPLSDYLCDGKNSLSDDLRQSMIELLTMQENYQLSFEEYLRAEQEIGVKYFEGLYRQYPVTMYIYEKIYRYGECSEDTFVSVTKRGMRAEQNGDLIKKPDEFGKALDNFVNGNLFITPWLINFPKASIKFKTNKALGRAIRSALTGVIEEDPFSPGQKLKVLRSGGTVEIYSVGPDLKDDGGDVVKRSEWNTNFQAKDIGYQFPEKNCKLHD